MIFRRTQDLDQVHKILTCPAIYGKMGDDFTPPAEEFQVPDDPRIVWLVAGGACLVGLFAFFPQNRVCWEMHSALLPWATKAEKGEAGRELAPWLSTHTECRRITASVPEWNRSAVYYGVHVIGMQYVGRHQKAIRRQGQLRDLIILGREIC